MNNPKISIVTPVYNSIEFLKNCLDSILSQTYQNIEHIIIDNNSNDGSSELAEEYSKKSKIIYHYRAPDLGIYDAMNKGIEFSTGNWILFLGSDDTLHSPNTIQEVFNSEIHERFDFIYGNVIWGDTEIVFNGEFSELKLMYQNIPHQAIFYKKKIFESIGKYNINYKIWADWELNIRCYEDKDIRFRYIDKVISNYRLGGYSSKIAIDEEFLKNKDEIFQTYFSKEANNILSEHKELSYTLNYLLKNIIVKVIFYIYKKIKLI